MPTKISWEERAMDQKAEAALATWLLEFAEVNFARVSTVVHQELAEQAHRFIMGNIREDAVFSTDERDPAKLFPMLTGHGGPFTLDQLRAFQDELRAGLNHLAQGEWWGCEGTARKEFLKREADGRLVLQRRGEGDWLQAFTLRAFRTFLSVSGRLRQCRYEQCPRWFIAVKRQEFCNSKHGAMVRTARFRTSQRERLNENRRRAYAKKVRKDKGLSEQVKIGRGPRRKARSA